MKRQLDDWIDSYIHYMKDTEYPIPYHIWNAVSCIAGALQRRVYIPWGRQIIYPNMFIILVGPSGVGKGESMKPAIDIFQETELPTAAEAITVAELINFMQQSENKYLDIATGRTIEHSSVHVFARELSVLLGQRDMKKISHLTDWYDSHDIWRNATKTAGKNFIKGVCLNILGACAPDWFPSMLPPEAMGGGFTSRIIFVVEDKMDKIIALPQYTDGHKKLRDQLANDLKILAAQNFSGPFNLNQAALNLYAQIYTDQQSSIKNDIYPIQDKAFRGYVARRMLHLRKISISMAASRGSEGDIFPQDIQRAFAILKNAEKKMPRLFGGVGRAPHGAAVAAVMNYMLNKGDASRSEILNVFSHELDGSNISIVEETLIYMRFMTVSKINDVNHPRCGEVLYILNKDFEKETENDGSQEES